MPNQRKNWEKIGYWIPAILVFIYFTLGRQSPLAELPGPERVLEAAIAAVMFQIVAEIMTLVAVHAAHRLLSVGESSMPSDVTLLAGALVAAVVYTLTSIIRSK